MYICRTYLYIVGTTHVFEIESFKINDPQRVYGRLTKYEVNSYVRSTAVVRTSANGLPLS